MVAAVAAALFALAAGETWAAAGEDADWPCVQRLVPELSAGQMWTGMVIDDLPADVALVEPLQGLADRLAAGDRPAEEAAKAIAEALAVIPVDQRPQQQALLFRTVLERINERRDMLIDGIRTYSRRQQALADKVTADGRRLVELRREPDKAAVVEELTSERAWDMRVFDERKRSLRALCDQPVYLEQQAFALARVIAAAKP
jgi:hypothetical protein